MTIGYEGHSTVYIECPVCENAELEVYLEWHDGEIWVEDYDAICGCRDSKFVKQANVDERVKELALEKAEHPKLD